MKAWIALSTNEVKAFFEVAKARSKGLRQQPQYFNEMCTKRKTENGASPPYINSSLPISHANRTSDCDTVITYLYHHSSLHTSVSHWHHLVQWGWSKKKNRIFALALLPALNCLSWTEEQSYLTLNNPTICYPLMQLQNLVCWRSTFLGFVGR